MKLRPRKTTPLLLILFLLTACSPVQATDSSPAYKLTILNNSSTEIQEFQYSQNSIAGIEAGGVQNADGSPFAPGDEVTLDFPAPENEVLLSARDQDDRTLASFRVRLLNTPDGSRRVQLVDSATGVLFQTMP